MLAVGSFRPGASRMQERGEEQPGAGPWAGCERVCSLKSVQGKDQFSQSRAELSYMFPSKRG